MFKSTTAKFVAKTGVNKMFPVTVQRSNHHFDPFRGVFWYVTYQHFITKLPTYVMFNGNLGVVQEEVILASFSQI